MKRLESLHRRLGKLLLRVALLPTALTLVAAVLVLQPMLQADALEQHAQLARALSGQVQAQLRARQRELELVLAGVDANGHVDADTSWRLHRLLQADPMLQSVALLDQAGRVGLTVQAESVQPPIQAEGYDLSAWPAAMGVLASRQPQWSTVYVSSLTGTVTAALVLPVGRGAAIAEFALDDLAAMLRQARLDPGLTLAIVDAHGDLIVTPDPGPTRLREHVGLENWQAQAGHAERGWLELQGRKHVAALRLIEASQWRVLVAQPVSEVFQPLARVLAAVLAVGLGVGLLTIWQARRSARQLATEATMLADAADTWLASSAAPGEPARVPEPNFTMREFDAVWHDLQQLLQAVEHKSQESQASRRRLQAVLDATPGIAIIVTGADGLVALFSRGAEQMLGYAASEVVGRCTPALWHQAEDLAAHQRRLALPDGAGWAELAKAMRGRPAAEREAPWCLLRADGQRLQVSLTLTALDDGGLEKGSVLGVAIDLGDRERLRRIESERLAAQAASDAKTSFLSRMSHELRSPLNAIVGFSQLMLGDQRHPLGPEQRHQAEHVMRAGWHLVQLIDDVLDLSRIEAGELAVRLADVPLCTLVQRAAELSQPQMVEYGVSCTLAPPPDEPVVRADPTRLTQVLLNLLSNAAKYNRRGGRVAVSCEQPGDGFILVHVDDTGVGLDAQALSHLFEPFNRLGQERSQIPGTGIGLVVTRRLLEMMGGGLEVVSRAGEGSRFTVRLALATARAASSAPVAAAEPGAPAAAAAAGSSRPLELLYIEDGEVNALVMRAMIERQPGWRLRVAATAGEGLRAARERRPDLLLLDMNLPDAHGSTVLRELEADPQLAGLPVVVVSADAMPSQRAQAYAQGVRAYLTKPLEFEQLISTIGRVLALTD